MAMDKELCLKFLVHLYRYSDSVARKPRINEADLVYINNEVDQFLARLDRGKSKVYDPAGALEKIARIPLESAREKAVMFSKFLLLAQNKWLTLFFGKKDDAHENRLEKVGEFKERVRKVITLIEMG
jgi:hypothetical protein